MGTKARLLVLVVALLLLLGGAWAALRPEGAPLIPFLSGPGTSSRAARITTAESEETVASRNDPAAAGTQPAADKRPKSTEDRTAQGESIRADGKPAPSNPGAKSAPKADEPKAAPQPAPDPAPAPAPPPPAVDAKPRPRAVIRGVRHPPNQSLGNTRPAPRKLKEEAGKKALDAVTPQVLQDRRGLLGRYYAFSSNPVDELANPSKPALESRTPGLTRIDQQIAFPNKGAFSDLPFDLANFFVTWEGFLVVPSDGDYWLFLGADLGGRVVLDSETVLLNDMFSDYIEVSTVLTLSAGLHPMRIEYVEGKNGSVVADLCACNLMYVPQGQSRPIPVPPEMLLLPENLWSNAAPVIERVSPKEAEIGAEVVIYGHHFVGEGLDAQAAEALAACKVDINGQAAQVMDASPTMLKIRVPIGASTGKLTVRKGDIPSNSVDFKVSTQFGLYAAWHNLEGWMNYDFVEPLAREPEITRLERDWQFNRREELELDFRNNPLACRWEGKLGVPKTVVTAGEEPPARLVRFKSEGRLRVTLGGETKSSPPPSGQSTGVTVLDFAVPYGDETYMPLTIDFTNEKGGASLIVVWAAAGSGADAQTLINAPVNFGERLPFKLFFPPVAPPKPPKIVSVTPVVPEFGPPATLPYDADTGRPSVREGQQFKLVVELYGSEEVRAQTLVLSIDGRKIEFAPDPAVTESERTAEGVERRHLLATLPTGCGEGKMVARLSIVQSEPYYIDVTNKGLVTYLYKFPNAGGYTQLPDFDPLVCFKVRKDPWINFENANFLNLPFPAETFGIEYYGALIIETEGDYVFTARSDDGIRVWVNGQEAVVDDNLHYQRERSGGPMRLTPGVYTFRAQFFENNVHEVFVLYFEAKDAQGKVILPKQVIPKRLFTWDQHPPLPDKSSTGKLSDGSKPPG